jgi:hypothetical protein
VLRLSREVSEMLGQGRGLRTLREEGLVCAAVVLLAVASLLATRFCVMATSSATRRARPGALLTALAPKWCAPVLVKVRGRLTTPARQAT